MLCDRQRAARACSVRRGRTRVRRGRRASCRRLSPRPPIGGGSGRGRFHGFGTLSRQKKALARQLNASWRKRLAGVCRREQIEENTP